LTESSVGGTELPQGKARQFKRSVGCPDVGGAAKRKAMIHQKMAHRSFTFEGCYHLAWVLERIQDHHANRIGELMPWEYYANT
jgi:hypothetical protein